MEAAALSIASTVLATITSSAITAAYEEGLSIWEAKDELSKLCKTIETLKAVLIEAEKEQRESNAVWNNKIKRFTEVLYDAQILFDEVTIRDLREQQITRENHNLIFFLLVKVLVSCSKLNPIISRYSISKKVKAIRESLVEIDTDISQFERVIPRNEVPTFGITEGEDPECYVNEKSVVIGREDDKQAVLKMLFSESKNDAPCPLVIAIVGIGGMGKTTLAQLIYNDDEVTKYYCNKWFVSIRNTSDERGLLRKILQSILGGDQSSLSVRELKTGIRDLVKDKKFFLVLDDAWDEDRDIWEDQMRLLSGCAEGSKIIVTTRSSLVADSMNASRAHNLEGLSEEDALFLFRRLAFTPACENDEGMISSGKKILKMCRGVPLAIQNVGKLCRERDTISEWKEIEREALLENINGDNTLSVIKVSYDRLPQNLKHCFAYFSLFPEGYKFMKHELVCLWVAQGYLELNKVEAAFMHLVRRGFLQDVEKDAYGEVLSCKIHDIMHDLASYVARKEISVLTSTTSWDLSGLPLHVKVTNSEWDVEQLKVKQLHSFFTISISPVCSLTTLDKLCKKFNMLRTLNLKELGLKETLPTSIGELLLLRYLDLSFNFFEKLPDSMSNLVNLLALNLMGCSILKDFPSKLGNLTELRYLNIEECGGLRGKLTRVLELRSLQYLYLGKIEENKKSGLDALARLQQQFRGDMQVRSDLLIKDKDDEFESDWKLPVRVQTLLIEGYMGVRLSDWGIIDGTNNYLAQLTLSDCGGVKSLPPLQCLRNLRWLTLADLESLEFVESEEVYSTSSSPYLPRLEKLELSELDSLKRWTKTTPTPLTFPLLSDLYISCCPLLELASFPQCQRLRKLNLLEVDVHNADVMQCQLPSTLFCPSVSTPLEKLYIRDCKWLSSLQLDATKSLRYLCIAFCDGLKKSVQLASPELHHLYIAYCNGLVSLEVSTPSLRVLHIEDCEKFKNLIIGAPLNALNTLEITDCPELDLLELELDWDSLVNLQTLILDPMPPTENIPLSLRNREALGALEIRDRPSEESLSDLDSEEETP